MHYFEPRTFVFNISNNEALERLNTVTKRHFFDRSKFYLFKGFISANSFKIRSADLPETILLVGKMEKTKSGKTKLSVSGKIVWTYLIINALLLLISSFTSFYLSSLLIKENTFFGVVGFLLSGLFFFLLYKQLIGPIKKNYTDTIKSVEDIFNHQLP